MDGNALIESKHIGLWRLNTKRGIEDNLLNKLNRPYQERIDEVIEEHYSLYQASNYGFILYKDQIFYFGGKKQVVRPNKKVPTKLHTSLVSKFAEILTEQEAAHKQFKVKLWVNYLDTVIPFSASPNDLQLLLPSFIHSLIKPNSFDNQVTPEMAEQIKETHKAGYQALCEQVTLNLVLT